MIKYRYLILRRITQIGLMVLYIGANVWGWNILVGNLSSSKIFEIIPMSDPYAVLQMFAAGAIIATDVFLGAIIALLFYLIIGGRAFCSWVCPVNIITDTANYLRRKLHMNQVEKKQPASRKIRYWIMVLGIVLSFILGITAFEFISPIGMVHRGVIFGLGFGWATILALFLFDLFVLKNGWCGHLCPLGGFYSTVGKFSLIRVKHEEEKCTICMKCKEVCPESQVLWMVGKESIQVLSGECTNCGRCIEVCDDDALSFSIKKLIEEKKMKKLSNITLSLIVASTLLFVGCNEASPKKEEVAKPTISEESLGLRKVDLYSENSVTPDETKYAKNYAGSGKTINRAFQDAPPMIPHDTEGMLPITINNNQCTSCHMPEVASSMGATAIPVSHFTNFRPKHNYDGKKFEKSIDNMKNEIAIDEMKTLAGARFNCSQCHAPQSEGQLVENTFQAEFTSKDGAKKSSWQGSKLTEGLNTLLDETK